MPEESRASVSGQSTEGSLVAGIPVADAFVGVLVGCSLGRSLAGSVGISFVEPSVAGSLKGPFVGRVLSSASFGFLASLLVSVYEPCIFSVISFRWSQSTRSAELFKFDTNRKGRSFSLVYLDMIVLNYYNLSMRSLFHRNACVNSPQSSTSLGSQVVGFV